MYIRFINRCIYNKDVIMSKAISIRLPDQLLLDVQAYARSNGVSVTDVIISGIQSQIYFRNTTEKPPCQSMPTPSKSPVASNSEVEKPAKTPDKAPEPGKALPNGYIVKSAYEPEPVRPVKQPKQSVSKAVQPIVKAMLSGVKARPTVAHHPTCTCAMCKDAA